MLKILELLHQAKRDTILHSVIGVWQFPEAIVFSQIIVSWRGFLDSPSHTPNCLPRPLASHALHPLVHSAAHPSVRLAVRPAESVRQK